MQFDSSIYAVVFANEQGDLLVSLGNEVVFVYVHDYLPITHIPKLLELPIVDDATERCIVFDDESLFWKKPEQGQVEEYDDVDYWQLL